MTPGYVLLAVARVPGCDKCVPCQVGYQPTNGQSLYSCEPCIPGMYVHHHPYMHAHAHTCMHTHIHAYTSLMHAHTHVVHYVGYISRMLY